MNKCIKLYMVTMIFVLLCSCERLIEIDPPITDITRSEAYRNNSAAIAVVTGIYTEMSRSLFAGRNSITSYLGLYTDELISEAQNHDVLNLFYKNSLIREDGEIWSKLYEYIYRVNSCLEGIEASGGLSSDVKTQLVGECHFMRSFMYFYLVNLYGDVPLILSTDVKKSSIAGRESISVVNAQIIADLKKAQVELNDKYLAGDAQKESPERIRPNRSCATFLLSRMYLYMKEYVEAEKEATTIINDTRYQLSGLEEVFLKTSKEAIWQLQPVVAFANTLDAQLFVLYEGNNTPLGTNPFDRPLYLSNQFRNAFEAGDKRRKIWTDSVVVDGMTYPFPYKYKVWKHDDPISEYLMIFRLAELFLIRSEARANLGKLTGVGSALEDLNKIRDRAGLTGKELKGKQEILNEILYQRKFELFTELGQRWFDIKRSDQTGPIMTEICRTKGTNWSQFRLLLPIPIKDISNNPSLRSKQNPGYPGQ